MIKFVPYLEKGVIEVDAERLLAEFAHARDQVVEAPIPIEDIVEKHLKLGVEFDDTHRMFGIPRSGIDLGQGPDILGAIIFDQKRIVIDESLDPEEDPSKEGRFRFTLAHEGGGHWRLHRHLFDDLKVPSVVCRSSRAKERIEWQADFYASCLLMPRALVFSAWRDHFGTDYPRIVGDFKASLEFAQPFAERFQVSLTAMRIRLYKLGLLRREMPRQKRYAEIW